MNASSQAPKSRGLLRMIEIACDLNARLRSVPQLSVNEVLVLRDAHRPLIWIDVRSEAEQQVSTLEHAIPVNQFDVSSPRPDQALVVAYCTAGFRSGSFAARLRRQGIDAVNLRGGLFAWCAAQQPLVDRNQRPTRRVHIYGRSWNFVPENYEGVT